MKIFGVEVTTGEVWSFKIGEDTFTCEKHSDRKVMIESTKLSIKAALRLPPFNNPQMDKYNPYVRVTSSTSTDCSR